jgi:hypothetical protein
VDLGVARLAYGGTVGNVDAPVTDIDGDTRYTGTPATSKRLDAGADERP